MKSVEFFCASPASTAICSSMDQRSMVRQGGIRPTDRHGHRLGDHHHRHKTRTPIPCSSHPISPRPYCDKNRKHPSSSSPDSSLEYLRRKSSADVNDISSPPPNRSSRNLLRDTPLLDIFSNSEHSSFALVRSQHLKVGSARHHSFNDYPALRSSMSSSTCSYDNPVYEFSSSFRSNDDFRSYRSSFLSRSNDDFHAKKSSLSRLINDDVHAQKSSSSRSNTSHASKSSITCSNESQACKSPSTRSRPHHQIVKLRVSIHCKGCEGKIRKHISRMEGVTSYSIDLETKKVTVIGNVTPLGVLTSISKVKNAEFWSSPTSSSSSSSPTVGMSLVST